MLFRSNSTNDTEAQESIGEGKYTAIGQIQTKQTTTLTTRTIQKQKTTVTTGYKYDPVAQSFFVYQNDYPLGFHISSIDVFFRTKSDTVPVEMQIRKNVNGYPESDPTLPFSSMVLQPDRVNVSTDGSVATTFQFANPIHLAPGEYSIVLLANTQEYQVYVAEMGGTVLGGTAKIDKQPYIGTLYVSQNASTWTPDQTKDLKFAIRRASFQSTGSAIFNIQDPDAISDYHTLFANASTVLPTGTSIKWYAKAYYGSQVFDVDWAPINIGQDINYAQLRKLAAASGIGVGGTDAPSLTLKAELSLDSSVVKRSEVSPVIDASSLSIVTALNTINNDYDYESGTNAGGNALAKYITKPVNLADGFHCTNLCVTVEDRKSTRLNSSHSQQSRMPSSA